MSEYQRKESRYVLPRNLYMATLYQIRDYYRTKQKGGKDEVKGKNKI